MRSRRGHGLAAEHQCRRPVRVLQRGFVRLGHLIRIAGAQHQHVGHGAQGSELLDRLVRRPIFADADGIVREDEERRYFHER